MKDLLGRRFERLLVIKPLLRRDTNGCILWECKCNCGNTVIIRSSNLLNGGSKSCGCLVKEKCILIGKNNRIHNKSKTQFYKIWCGIKKRCNNKNSKSYKNYGGRGITYDERWDNFIGFFKDMYMKYLYAKKQLKLNKLSIERINNNGNYCFENCTFIEMGEQSKNRRSWSKIF